MAAMSHAFKTEVENKSTGKPSFLSRHIDALCPPTQEEDEWLDQELERARLQRGTFYKKLANSRSASARELEDLNASKLRSASRGSTERELSLSPSGSTTSPPPAIPEPHSSWRFYTSFDNGEWKRHCVPVYKAEEDILMKSPSDSANKENSPAYESHLRKYRQARASLFDRPSPRRLVGISPREETTTVRIVSGGNDVMNRGSTGSARLPFGGRSSQEGNIRSMEHHFDDKNGPSSFPPAYRQEVVTSETITTIHGADPNVQAKDKPQTPAPLKDPSRPKHNHLGFKEKVIVPTKYKTDAEKEVSAAVSKVNGLQSIDSFDKKETGGDLSRQKIDVDADKPSFLGSTFEKFSYSGVPLVKPSSVDLPPNKPIFGNSSTMNVPVKVENLHKSSFDSSVVKPSAFSSLQHSSSEHIKPSFQDSNLEMSSYFGTPFSSSTPVKNNLVQTSMKIERSSLPFSKAEGEHTIPVNYSPNKESSKVSEVPALEVTGENISLGNQFSAFSAPCTTKSRQISAQSDIVHETGINTASSADVKKEGVIFIPVIRVLSPSKDQHSTQTTANSQSNHCPHESFDRFRDVPILELEEDKRGAITIKEEISRNTPVHEKIIFPSSVSRDTPVHDKVASPSTTVKQATHDSGRAVNGTSFQEKIIIPSKLKNQVVLPESAESKRGADSFQEKIIIPSTAKGHENIISGATETSWREKVTSPSLANYNAKLDSSGSFKEIEINKNTSDISDSTPSHFTQMNDAQLRVQQRDPDKEVVKKEKPVFSNERNYKSQFEVAPQRIPISVDLSSLGREHLRPAPDEVKIASENIESKSNNASSVSRSPPNAVFQTSVFNTNISPKLQFWSPSASPSKDQVLGSNLSSTKDTTVDKEYSFDTDDWVVEKAVRF